MTSSELNEMTSKYIIESGHNRCHPETCTCWNFRIFEIGCDGKKGSNVLNTDSSNEVKRYLSENDPDFK